MNYRDRQAFFHTLKKLLQDGSKILIAGAGFHYDTIAALAPTVLETLCGQVVAVQEPELYIESYGGGCLHFMNLQKSDEAKGLAATLKSSEDLDYVFLLEQHRGEFRKEYNRYVLTALAKSFHGQLVCVNTGPMDETTKE